MADKEATLLIRIKEAGGDILDHFVITLGDIMHIAGEVKDALVDMAKESIHAYHEQELAVHELTTAMVSQGVFTEELKNKYIGMAEALQKTTAFNDEQIISAQAVIQSYIGHREVTEELTQATLDFAAAKKMDLASAAEVVGKSIGSSTNALSRYGVEITDSTDKTERMAGVISGITQKWDGQSEAQIRGLGVMGQASKSWGEFLETVGQRLAPVVEYASQKLIVLFDTMNNIIKPSNEASISVQQLRSKIYELNESIGELESKKEGAHGIGMFGNFLGSKESLDAQINEQKLMLEKAGLDLVALQEEQKTNKTNADTAELTEMQNHNLLKQEQMLANMEYENALISANAESVLSAQIQKNDKEYQIATDQKTKLRLLDEKEKLLASQNQVKHDVRMIAEQKKADEENAKQQQSFFSTTQTLASSNNKALAAIGRASSLAQIAMKTPEAAANAYAFGTRTGGPILGGIFAGMAVAAMAAQASKVAGVPLADGGIVKARPGGIQATIGEGGRDEAVVPLGKSGGMGTTINITVNGGLLGKESDAREFAVAIDREMFKLRRDNSSLAFDSGIL